MKKTSTAIAALAAFIVVTGANAVVPVVGTPAYGAPDPGSVVSLTQVITDTIRAQPVTATSADIEAAIAFAIDNAKQSPSVINAALAAVPTDGMSRYARTALANVKMGRRMSGDRRGTGGLAGGGDPTLAAGPSVGGGGGGTTSTYTTGQQ